MKKGEVDFGGVRTLLMGLSTKDTQVLIITLCFGTNQGTSGIPVSLSLFSLCWRRG